MEAPTSHHRRQTGRSTQRSRKLEQEDATFLVPNSLLVADTITLLNLLLRLGERIRATTLLTRAFAASHNGSAQALRFPIFSTIPGTYGKLPKVV